MGETPEDRAAMLVTLSCLNPYPESVPINALVAVEGTPMEFVSIQVCPTTKDVSELIIVIQSAALANQSGAVAPTQWTRSPHLCARWLRLTVLCLQLCRISWHAVMVASSACVKFIRLMNCHGFKWHRFVSGIESRDDDICLWL